MPPVKAADYAADIGLRIYTIGIGSERGRAELDEDTLKTIADKTGGRYFRARNSSELSKIYRHIDRLEPRAEEQSGFRQEQELFYWPLAGALLLSLLVSLWSMFPAILLWIAGLRNRRETTGHRGVSWKP